MRRAPDDGLPRRAAVRRRQLKRLRLRVDAVGEDDLGAALRKGVRPRGPRAPSSVRSGAAGVPGAASFPCGATWI